VILTPVNELPRSTDVLVIGSGAAGLTAATRAAETADVVVLEKAAQLGGTTAAGGGVLWAPANELGRAAGYEDSRQEGIDYLLAATESKMSEEDAAWYVDRIGDAVTWLTSNSRVNLVPLARPDYRLTYPGSTQGGRSLDNAAVDVGSVPGLREALRPSSYFPLLTMEERDNLNGAAPDPDLLASRAADGVRTMGGALAASLLLSALDRGVKVASSARVTGLERGEAGWTITVNDGESVITAANVVVASGGFEWNTELQSAFLPHPITPISAPSNEGDGLLLGLRAGAAVDQMTTFWGVPVITPPTQTYDGHPSGRMGNVEMTLPGSIVVGSDARRFVNEAMDYHGTSEVMGSIDAHSMSRAGIPAWLIFDRTYLDSYPVAGSTVGQAADWMVTAESIEALAAELGLDAETLAATVARFNEAAERGEDPDFGRGASAEDRFLGDDAVTPNPCLRALATGPFHAVPLHIGALGTSGGLSTDADARVLDFTGAPIPGLFAAGNVSATPFGGAYPGGGSTLGPAVLRGFVAGEYLAAHATGTEATA
jgi:3-oxosteroid 1-dehydrogenase